MRVRRLMAIVAATALAGAALTTATPVAAEQAPAGLSSEAVAAQVSARRLLRSLKVRKERNAGYDRAKFIHWIDADGDSCDTREEVLIAESLKPVRKASGCSIQSGKWYSRYDGVRTRNPSTFDVDHMVPLAEAWGAGAKAWNSDTRKAFANDLRYPYSLIAVSASSNRSKSDRDPSEWLPPRRKYQCFYAKTWIAVKWRWQLTVNKGEKDALRRIMNRQCGSLAVPKPARATIRTGTGDGGGGGGGGGGGCNPNYAGACIPNVPYDLDCSDITARNFRVVGTDVYGFDGDGDGIACET